LKIEYFASTDKSTVFNPTSHGYFNLSGQGTGTILQQQLKLNASRFTPVDSGLIPTGELKPVPGTPFDFLAPHAVGERINADDEQLKLGHDGYDHNFVIDGGGKSLVQAAEVYDPASGRVMQVLTTEPGVQFYTGNFLDGTIKGKKGTPYVRNAALCLETQHFPDSPNQPAFPSTTLNPGEKFHSETIYRFSVR
jgi:aldose 1-epimerase